MIVIEPVTLENLPAFKAVRLRALLEDPSAFSATHEKESQFSDSEWLARVDGMSGEKGIGFLATDCNAVCGLVAAFLSDTQPNEAHVVSMWTAPEHRRRGAGRLLIEAVAHWAREHDSRTLQVMVTSVNEPAIRFYQRLGFAKTGGTGPYPNDPAILEYEMSRRIL
jgi:ribosomal protein S18 acetylase RimI-like enzyme